MSHQPRRRRARGAGVLLGVLVLLGVTFGRLAVVDGRGPTARADTGSAGTAPLTLDVRTRPVFSALNDDRIDASVRPLRLDDRLVETAARDACAIARGELALSGDRERMTEGGGHRENVGMVIDEDPIVGARTMHRWWAQTARHRHPRMDPDMARYGIGACNAEDRTYYVERFAP